MTDLDSLTYTADHEWVAANGDGTVTIGVTDYAADKLGDVVYVELPAVGTAVVAGSVCGEIESTKSVGEVYAPLSGSVVAVNDSAVDDPSLVNSEPFGRGWLLRLEVDPAGLDGLLSRAEYVALTGGDE
ncbi:MAG: glycine cleavage system protein GcvH [Microbacterium sp.]